MLKTLGQLGLIEKQPGVARSIQLLVPPHELPNLCLDQLVTITAMVHKSLYSSFSPFIFPVARQARSILKNSSGPLP
jgi:hypothetical protein